MVKFTLSAIGITQLKAVNGRLYSLTNIGEINPNIVQSAVRYAKAIAPNDTGAERNAIQGRYGTKNTGVYVKTPNNPDGRKRPYMLWHHGLGIYPQVRDGPTAPTSGVGDFLFDTGRYMKRLTQTNAKKFVERQLTK